MNVDAPDDNFTVLRSNGDFFLTEDEDGFAIWSVRADNQDPVLTFPAGADGRDDAERAFRRETHLAWWSQVLLYVSITGGLSWIAATLVAQILQWDSMQERLRTSAWSWRPQIFANAVSAVGYAAFLVGVGLFVVLWLHRRYRREG